MKRAAFFLLALWCGFAHALLEITILKKEENALPVAIAPFKILGLATKGDPISTIVENNLNRSGRFEVRRSDNFIDEIDVDFWKSRKIDAVIRGNIAYKTQKIFTVSVDLYDVYADKKLFTKKSDVHVLGVRRFAHQLSDLIYEKLLGEKGAFDTLLTYVTVEKTENGRRYHLEISDSDAQNPQTVLASDDPILSPAWSPDQNKIAYVSFKNHRSEVFVQYPFVRRKTQKLPRFDGIASAPNWHPDGEKIVLTLSKNGNKDLYLYDLENENLERLTENPAIDTEANFSPDGQSLAFTSNRSGQVQIYLLDIESGNIERLSYAGDYNAKPVFSPDGKSLALVHRQADAYRIAIFDLKTKDLTVMTENILDESPYFSPNGDMIIYATNDKNRGVLSVVSLTGRRQFELASRTGEVREPNWSRYLRQ